MKLLIRGQVMYAVEQEATLERGWETREEWKKAREGRGEERVGEVGQVNETCRRQEQETGARNGGEWGGSEDKENLSMEHKKNIPPIMNGRHNG